MGFELFCMSIIALLIGLAICFNGYRWFLILLPILGFFFGFGLGAQTLTALFGVGFLATISSWVVGFIVGLIFAVLSYLFYLVGVGVFAFSLGYGLGTGFMGLFGLDLSFITWLVGVVVGVVVAAGTIFLNLQKWVIIAVTSLGGAGVIVGTLMMVLGKISPEDLGTNAVRMALNDSFLWLLFFLVLAALGFAAQAVTSRGFEFDAPENRYATAEW